MAAAVAENGLKSAYKATPTDRDRPTENESSMEKEEGEFNPLLLPPPSVLLQLSAAVVRPFGGRRDVASAVSVGKYVVF